MIERYELYDFSKQKLHRYFIASLWIIDVGFFIRTARTSTHSFNSLAIDKCYRYNATIYSLLYKFILRYVQFSRSGKIE